MENTTVLASRDERRAFNRRLFAMVLPLAFQGFMTAAVNASDAIMLGFLEQEALSAVSLAGQVTFVLNLCITVLVQGTTMLAAQYWGKGDRDTVEKILGLSMRYVTVVTAVFLGAAVICPQLLMRAFTNEQALVERGASYLRIAELSYVPLGVSQLYLCIMKNSGRTAKSTVIGSSAMLLNVGLNVLFIFGLKMGIQGAALATALAMLLQAGWTLAQAAKRGSIKICPAYLLKTDKALRMDFLHYTWPIVGNYFFWGGGVTIFSSIIGHLGSDAVAANSVASIIRNMSACVATGVGTAGAILVGNELGRNEIERAKVYARRVLWLAGGLGLCAGILLLCLRPMILKVITLTPAAQANLSGMLLICSYYVIAGAVNGAAIGGIFCAGGKSRFGCICDGVVLWGIITPLALTAAFWLHLPTLAVYFIIMMDEVVKVPVALWYFRRYSWAQNLTR